MRPSNCGVELTDLQSPVSIFACFNSNGHFHTPRSASFRRTPGVHKAISWYSSSPSPRSVVPSVRAPEIRKPADRVLIGNGSLSNCSNSVSISRSKDSVSELGLFVELVPSRMRHDLLHHKEIEDLIEVVMDLGRKPLARFPSGDWIISEEQVKPEDFAQRR